MNEAGRPSLLKLQRGLKELEGEIEKDWRESAVGAADLKENAAVVLFAVAICSLLTVAVLFLFLRSLVEQKKMMDLRREEISRARKEIVEVVAHDLRNPLSLIRMSLIRMSLIRMSLEVLSDPENDEDNGEVLGIAQRGVKQAFELIGLILDHARLETGGLIIQRHPCDLKEFLNEQSVLFTGLCAEKKIKLEIDCSTLRDMIPCDRVRISQVLSNLIGNAVKFSPKESRIIVSAETLDDGHVVVSVRDHGRGIPAEAKQRIFDRYWQTGKGEYSGIGLGLAISKGIVEAHGGRIWVEDADGAGSLFYFSMPSGES
ncbi:MAG: HAMP domain-containing histidine kinase [Bdellovibrionaceae bacterium]|nr:HAMP domain-containing histidine kinase [Pseudobdellovibrionaceae bacterium]